MSRTDGGPIRKSHRRLTRFVLLLLRLHVDWIARRLMRYTSNLYIVGEQGPERVTFARDGYIIPALQYDDFVPDDVR